MIRGYKKFQIALVKEAMGLCVVFIVSRVEVCTGLVANMSNSVLADTTSAAMVGYKMIRPMKLCLFL